MSGAIYGKPAATITGLGGAATAKLRERGGRAERQTATLLNPLADRGIVVFHSLPVPGKPADIDHIVVGPAGAVVIDTKCWMPGWYVSTPWGMWRYTGGLPRRFAHGRSPALMLSVRELANAGVKVRGAVVAAWPSRPGGQLHTALARYQGGYRILEPQQAVEWALARTGVGVADAATVSAIRLWSRS